MYAIAKSGRALHLPALKLILSTYLKDENIIDEIFLNEIVEFVPRALEFLLSSNGNVESLM